MMSMKKYNYLLCGMMVCLFSACSKSGNTDLYQEIKSVDKMVFAKMAITKTVFNNQENILGKRFAADSYDTYARAYIDLSSLQTDDLVFDDNNKTVKVKLPAVVAELIGRDVEMREEYKNVTGMRWELEEKEIAKLKEDGNRSMKKEWEENPMFKEHLIEAAQRKARKYFESIFEANGYIASIDFKNSDTNNYEKNN